MRVPMGNYAQVERHTRYVHRMLQVSVARNICEEGKSL